MSAVLVTGIGAVTCHGGGVPALRQAMSAARVRLPDRPADPLAHMALPLIHLVPQDLEAGHPGRAAQFALAAAVEALADAGLATSLGAGLPTGSLGIVVGSCMGEAGLWERQRYPGSSAPGWNPVFRLAAHLGDRLGVLGPATDVANACAAGLFSIAVAVDMIRAGEADVVLAGGADAYSRTALACFNRLGAVDPVRCRPFDRQRAGTIFGEGAGMLILESAEHAAARGARVRARVAGAAMSCDAHHPTAPEPDGTQIARTMADALAEAGGGPVGAVVPHGTGTHLNDLVESSALGRVLGAAVTDVPLYSLKALLGHTGGAAAGLAACAATVMLGDGKVPPNVPTGEQDPDCPVWLPLRAQPLTTGRVLVNAYGFGGANASVVLEAAS
jgi:3-oxoacyl-[acyl-carrier-protein] synthase II